MVYSGYFSGIRGKIEPLCLPDKTGWQGSIFHDSRCSWEVKCGRELALRVPWTTAVGCWCSCLHTIGRLSPMSPQSALPWLTWKLCLNPLSSEEECLLLSVPQHDGVPLSPSMSSSTFLLRKMTCLPLGQRALPIHTPCWYPQYQPTLKDGISRTLQR